MGMVQYQFLCRRRRFGDIAVTGSVQNGTVPTFRNNERNKSCKSMRNLSCMHLQSSLSESRSCDRSCMLSGVALYSTKRDKSV